MFFKQGLMFVMMMGVFLPGVTSAQVDTRCFTKADCTEARQGFGLTPQEAAKGFDINASKGICGQNFKGETLGFCAPGSDSQTQVTFGGRRDFANIGDFIALMYEYGIVLIGLFSSIMIIVAGAQWVTSGGSPDRVQSAKKRIGGAVTGLILASFSYVILNYISPSLVSFRLPQIWMINSFDVAPSLCGEIVDNNAPGKTPPLLSPVERTISPSTPTKEVENILNEAFKKKSVAVTDKDLGCGPLYYVQGTAGQTCIANTCTDPHEICIQGTGTSDPNAYVCVPGKFSARIYNSDPGADSFGNAIRAVVVGGWDWGALTGANGWVGTSITTAVAAPELKVLCADKKSHRVAKFSNNYSDDTSKIQTIVFALPESTRTESGLKGYVSSRCGGISSSRFLGFYLEMDFNEAGSALHERHAIGVRGQDLGSIYTLTDGTFIDKVKAGSINPSELFSLNDYLDRFGNYVNIDANRVDNES